MSAANLSLALSNTPGDVATVHSALDGVAAALGLDALDTDNLHTAVGEACKNVIHHAYEGLEGPLEVEVLSLGGALEVVVRDHGMGIRPLVGERSLPHTGIGMPIVHSLTRRITYTNLEGGGTEVSMLFDMVGAGVLGPAAAAARPAAGDAQDGVTEIALAPATLAEAVLPRILVALAARAEFTAERLAEVQALARALAAGASRELGEQPLAVRASAAPGELTLRIGPLPAGGGDRLTEAGDGEAQERTAAVIAGRDLCADAAAEHLELRLSGGR